MNFTEIQAPTLKPRAAPVTPLLDACRRGKWYLAEPGTHYTETGDPVQDLERYRTKLYNYAKVRKLKITTRKQGIAVAFCIHKAS